VKEAVSANEKLRQVVSQQRSIMSDQSVRIAQLRQDLKSARSSLSQLSAARECHDVETDQLLTSLRLQLHAVSNNNNNNNKNDIPVPADLRGNPAFQRSLPV